MLILAFDTATDVATSAVDDGEVLGQRVSVARTVLEDVDALLGDADVGPEAIDGLVGDRPGQLHEHAHRPLARARHGARAGRAGRRRVDSDALASARAGAFPIVDARRGEVFVRGPAAVAPDELEPGEGILCVGSGAVRYRATLERKGAVVPADDDPVHVPRAFLHVTLAREYGQADEILPIMCALPTRRCGAPRERRAQAPRGARSRHRGGDRARLLPDTVVAVDVRGRAAQAEPIAIGAYLEEGVLVGYAFVSRYVDAWHVMNVAIAPEFRRR